MEKKSNPIQRKVKAGATGGAAAVVLLWLAGQLGFEISQEVAGAFVGIISPFFAWLVPNVKHAIEERLDTEDA